jgi:hypothetical protein
VFFISQDIFTKPGVKLKLALQAANNKYGHPEVAILNITIATNPNWIVKQQPSWFQGICLLIVHRYWKQALQPMWLF